MERHNGGRQGRKRIEKDKQSFEGNRDKQRKMLHILEDSAFSLHVSIFFSANVKISSFSIIKMLWFISGTIPWECPGAISSQSQHR